MCHGARLTAILTQLRPLTARKADFKDFSVMRALPLPVNGEGKLTAGQQGWGGKATTLKLVLFHPFVCPFLVSPTIYSPGYQIAGRK